MKLSALFILLVAVVCVIQAKQQTEAKKGAVLDKKNLAKLAKMVTNSKKSMDKRGKAKESNLAKKQGGDDYYYGPYCVGAKCECDDYELTGAFLALVGNVVSNCRISDLYLKAFGDLYFSQKRQLGNDYYDYYGEICGFMKDLGLYYVEVEYEPPATLAEEYDSILTCCDYEEFIMTFHCAETYMSLYNMKVAEFFHHDPNVFKTYIFESLESIRKYQCDSVFHNENCLAMGLTGDPELDNCVDKYSPLELGLPQVSDEEALAAIEQAYNELIAGAALEESSGGESSDAGSSGSSHGGQGGNNPPATKRGMTKKMADMKEIEGLLKQILRQKTIRKRK